MKISVFFDLPKAMNDARPAFHFNEMKTTLDNLKIFMGPRAYLVTTPLLKQMADQNNVLIQAANKCRRVSTCKDGAGDHNNPRIGIPNQLVKYIDDMVAKEGLEKAPWRPLQRQKKPHSWIVCYVYDISPDQTAQDWERFQCSHLCTNNICITVGHLHWESSAINQARGNPACTRVCAHQGCQSQANICTCNNIHNPPCI